MTRTQYLQIVGLTTLADGYRKSLEQVEAALVEHLHVVRPDHSEDELRDHVTDAIYGSRAGTLEILSERLDLEDPGP